MQFQRTRLFLFFATGLFVLVIVAPSHVSALSISKDYQLWDTSPNVRALQQWLNADGYPLAESGTGSPGQETDTFGPLTYQALAKFQQANGLPASGYLGPLTRAKIAEVPSAASSSLQTNDDSSDQTQPLSLTRDLSLGDSGPDVSSLQQFLQAQGFFSYPSITGYYGEVTQAAVVAFQTAHGISATGFFGPLTRAAVNSILSSQTSSTYASSSSTTASSTSLNVPPAATTTAATTTNVTATSTATSTPAAPQSNFFNWSPGGGGGGGGTAASDTQAPTTPTNLATTIIRQAK